MNAVGVMFATSLLAIDRSIGGTNGPKGGGGRQYFIPFDWNREEVEMKDEGRIKCIQKEDGPDTSCVIIRGFSWI